MRALWAFTPFDADSKQLAGFYRTLAQVTGSEDDIEVGFISSHTESDLNLAMDVPRSERHTAYPKKLIKSAQRGARISIDDAKIHVVDYPTVSTTKAVDRLLRLARERNAGLIGLFTQARRGFQRLVLGSFAETAIHRSKTNLLLASPKATFSPKIRTVLFASDFSESSMKHLRSIVALCRRLKAKLIVYHAAEMAFRWANDDRHPGVEIYRRQVEARRIAIQKMCARGGVSCDVRITADFATVAKNVLRLAQEKSVDLIVVTAKAGPAATLVGGSVTRRIARTSSTPVLVLKDAAPRPAR
jgi:nucleotide-binding universal stress UspA family protein